MSTRGSAEERHVPVLRERMPRAARAGAAASPGRCSSTPRSAWAATPRRCWRACPAARARRHRPRHRGARRWRGGGWPPSATASPAVHAVYDELPRRPRRPGAGARCRACCSTSASPRCSWTRPSAASPTGTTRRSTCGWTRRRASPPPTCSTPTTPRELDPDPARVRRGAVRPPDRRGRSSASASGSPSPPAPGWSRCSGEPSRRPRSKSGGHPAQAHLPGPADRGQRRAGGAGSAPCPPRSTRSPSAAGSSSSATTRSRTGWPSSCSPRGAREHHPAGPAGRAARARAVPAAAHPRRRGARRRREGHEPARSVGPAAGRGTHQSHEGTARMSQMTAPSRIPRTTGRRPAPAPGLRVVPGTRGAPAGSGSAAFAVACIALLAAGLISLLLINISMSRGVLRPARPAGHLR